MLGFWFRADLQRGRIVPSSLLFFPMAAAPGLNFWKIFDPGNEFPFVVVACVTRISVSFPSAADRKSTELILSTNQSRIKNNRMDGQDSTSGLT